MSTSILLSEESAAAALGVAPDTLRVWRSKSRRASVLIGPRWVEIGGTGRARLIRYRAEDLDAYVEAGAVRLEPPKRRGRPRKTDVEAGAVRLEPPKRRGRPRKTDVARAP